MKNITAIIIEPRKAPRVECIDSSLENLQALVGGTLIEILYPFEDQVGMVVSESGKLDGMELNRALYDVSGEIYDIVYGPIVLVGLSEENITSLSDEQVEKYMKVYEIPELFFRYGPKLLVFPLLDVIES